MAKKETPPPAEENIKAGSEAEGMGPPKKKGGKLKLVLMIVGAMAVGIGLAVGGMMFFGGGSTPPEPAAAEAEPVDGHPPVAGNTENPIQAPTNKAGSAPHPSEGDNEGDATAAGEVSVGPQNIEFKPFVVNLSGGGGKRYLKLSMSVEADTPELAAEISAKMHQFQDIILLLLSSLSYDDIATLDGKMRLRNQMLNRINTQLSSGKVRNIYFSEFVVQ